MKYECHLGLYIVLVSLGEVQILVYDGTVNNQGVIGFSRQAACKVTTKTCVPLVCCIVISKKSM